METRKLVVAVALIVLGTFEGGQTGAAPVDATATEQHHVVVDEATQLFVDAGLELPDDLAIVFERDEPVCRGRSGWYDPRTDPPRITICVPDTNARRQRETLVHELAHAWDAATLTDEARVEFRVSRGVPTWLDTDEIWVRRAGEHAAEIVKWGLIVEPRPIVTVPYESCAELAECFEALTDRPPRGRLCVDAEEPEIAELGDVRFR